MKSSQLTNAQLKALCKLCQQYMFDRVAGMENEEIDNEELIEMMDEYERCLNENIKTPRPSETSGFERNSNEHIQWLDKHVGCKMLTCADWMHNCCQNMIGRAEAFGNIVLKPIILNNDFSMLKLEYTA